MISRTIIAFIFLFSIVSCSQPLMLEAKQDFINKLSKTNMAVFFYGTSDSPEYRQFQGILPSDRELFSDLEFCFIPADSIKLAKPKQSLFIFRNIEGKEWINYDGPMQTSLMSQWVRKNCFDSLRQLKGEDIDEMFVNKTKGFVLLQFGQFNLLGTKILLHDFCQQKSLLCGKCTIESPILNMVIQLMRADDQPGVPKLAFWDPNTQKFQLYTEKPLHQLTRENLLQIVQGRQGLVKSDTSNIKIIQDQQSQQYQNQNSSQEQQQQNEQEL